jgi:hypothetical protein
MEHDGTNVARETVAWAAPRAEKRAVGTPNAPSRAPVVASIDRIPTPSKFTRGVFGVMAAVLTIIWLGGVTFHIGGNLVHLLLLIAIVLAVVRISMRNAA